MDFKRTRLTVMIRKYTIFFVIICMLNSALSFNTPRKQKRQIFREQVLPSSGGKIPESAFRSDRLNLNRLNKDGYSFPDGFLIQHRRNLRHPYPYHMDPEVLKVYLTDDGRFVSIFGKYFTDSPEAIDTTYTIRSPVKLKTNHLNYLYKHLAAYAKRVFEPVLSPLILPNSALYENPSKHILTEQSKRVVNTILGSESYQRPRYYYAESPLHLSEEKFSNFMFTPEVFSQQTTIFRGFMSKKVKSNDNKDRLSIEERKIHTDNVN